MKTWKKNKLERDRVFNDEIKKPYDFKFGGADAEVFDDMMVRSVPFYDEILRMIVELTAEHALSSTNIVDLRCLTGTTMTGINPLVGIDMSFVGINDSEAMLEKCGQKIIPGGS